MGYAIDKYTGPNVATYFMSPMAVLGSGIVSFAAYNIGNGYDNLFWIGFCMLGSATFCGSLLSVQAGLYFTGITSTRVIMFLNALFDAGSVTYLFLMVGISYGGLNFGQVTFIYFCIAIVCYGGGIYFWNTAIPEGSEGGGNGGGFDLNDQGHVEDEKLLIQKETIDVSESLREYAVGRGSDFSNSKEINKILISYRESLSPGGSISGSGEHHDGGKYGSISDENESQPTNTDTDYALICDRSPYEQLTSAPFINLVLFFSLNMLSCNWTL
jgi:hypothetical protein